MVWRHVWWEVCRSVGLAVALHGCAASEWVHLSQPPADLAADQAACYAQLPQETVRPPKRVLDEVMESLR